MALALLLCRRCKSNRLDVNSWNGDQAKVRCYDCGNEELLQGFVVSLVYPQETGLEEALREEAKDNMPNNRVLEQRIQAETRRPKSPAAA